MIYDFAFFLTLAVIITGLITLIDVLLFARKRKATGQKPSLLIEYARAFFPVLLLVWVIRSFIIQPYRVPSSSLVPTVQPGDLIAVKQYEYGLRLPVVNKKIVDVNMPQRGQIALFRFPLNPSITYIKRVIGLPGDHIVYRNKTLYINGKEAKQKLIEKTHYIDDSGILHNVSRVEEDLDGVKHQIFLDDDRDEMDSISNPYDDVVVPPGHYFMMGDNRDDSGDSRVWGFVPDKNLIGQAFLVFMSWDSRATSWSDKIRWHHVGTWLTPQTDKTKPKAETETKTEIKAETQSKAEIKAKSAKSAKSSSSSSSASQDAAHQLGH